MNISFQIGRKNALKTNIISLSLLDIYFYLKKALHHDLKHMNPKK